MKPLRVFWRKNNFLVASISNRMINIIQYPNIYEHKKQNRTTTQ